MARNGKRIGRGPRDTVSEFVDHVSGIVTRELQTAGLAESQARDLATTIVHQICSRYAKQTLYIPGLLDMRLTERDLEMWDAYCRPGPTGSRPCSHERLLEIAAERGLSDRHLYSIFKLARQRELAARQGTLPGLDDQ